MNNKIIVLCDKNLASLTVAHPNKISSFSDVKLHYITLSYRQYQLQPIKTKQNKTALESKLNEPKSQNEKKNHNHRIKIDV